MGIAPQGQHCGCQHQCQLLPIQNVHGFTILGSIRQRAINDVRRDNGDFVRLRTENSTRRSADLEPAFMLLWQIILE
jgi:hypothetical protein